MTPYRSVCGGCGFAGAPFEQTPGSSFLEVVLWILFVVPGIVYSIWRVSARHPACAMCGGSAILPAGSPRGLELTKGAWPAAAETHYRNAIIAASKGGFFFPVVWVLFGIAFVLVDSKPLGFVAMGIGIAMGIRRVIGSRNMLGRLEQKGQET